MLVLQKASAGSGKTYTLARQYLIYLLTVDTGVGLRLRSREELEESARHILAITFTNKATAEMKDRIVMRLADLANPDLPAESTTYMPELTGLLGVDSQKIRATAATALSVLLNNYSDFQVSTIDSFFQTILRTFAHEIGLNDAYAIEMDDEFIARSAFDATLTDVNTAVNDRRLRRWLSALMKAAADTDSASWNLFAKSHNDSSLYSTIIGAVRKMAGEDFKLIRRELGRFFDSREDTLADFKALETHFNGPVADAMERGRRLSRRIVRIIDPVRGELAAYVAGRFEKMAKATLKEPLPFKCSQSRDKANAFKKGVSPDSSPLHREVADAYGDLIDIKDELTRLLDAPAYKLWQLYRVNQRLLPLMQMAAAKSASMLAENNVVDISETNSILRRVIGDDDAPFIYERLGTKLNHYLIDEFQDTSAMQWANLRPLIDESMSRNNGNLIIGDAKQSIYRFRNADPSLISHRVPADFAGRVDSRGSSRAENTNHRSLRTIVETNNSIFYALSRRLDELQQEVEDGATGSAFFASLYSNTAQYPRRQTRLGYFEMKFVGKGENGDTASDDGAAGEIPPHFDRLGPLIRSLTDRGYRMSDIAVLVRSRKTGNAVVQALMEYNMANPGNPIMVVSEESLLVSSAVSVKTILSVLRLISEGALLPERDKEQSRPQHRRKMSMALFNCRYQLIALEYPDYSPEQIISYINSHPADDEPLRRLLDSVSSLTLPSLVESIVHRFVSPHRRGAEAPFIAAFQDLVLDYCDSYSADILSFLQWWDTKGDRSSISSPEGIDAVTVMTVHKAKGLEYKCVIIPHLKERVSPGAKKEWRWVQTDVDALCLPPELRAMMPAYLPVVTGKEMLDTPHSDEYVTYLRQYRMDVINTWYVAFTRAVAELYVFADGDGTDSNSVAAQIALSLDDVRQRRSDAPDGIPADMVNIESHEEKGAKGSVKHVYDAVTIGEPLGNEAIAALGESNDDLSGVIELTDYFVSDPGDVLRFRDPEGGNRYTEDPDPRSLGNRLHDIMAAVITRADLGRAVLERVVGGHLTREEAREAETLLAAKLDNPQVASWFMPGLRVINERPLLARATPKERPDRIVVDAEGRATVIDYKFGTHRADSRYSRQVRTYMARLRESGRFIAVKGYIWYVMLDKIVEVTEN